MKYIHQWTEENHCCYDFEPSFTMFDTLAKEKFGFGVENGIMFAKNFVGDYWLLEKDAKQLSEHAYNFLINKDNFANYLKDIDLAKRKVSKITKFLKSQDLTRLTSQELFDLYILFWDTLTELFTCYFLTGTNTDKKLTKKLKLFLIEKTDDVNDAMVKLTRPKTKLIVSKSANQLSKSFSETIKSEDHVVDWSLLDAELYDEVKENQQERIDLLEKLNSTEEIRHIIEVLSTLPLEKLKMRYSYMPALYVADVFNAELKRRYNVSKKEQRMYDGSELDDLFLDGKKVDTSILREREKGFLKIMKNQKFTTLDGDEALVFVKGLTSRDNGEEVEELVGSVASKGKAFGKVVLFDYRDADGHSRKMQEMNKGDILVTQTTRPNLMLACEKAGAIVTEEGGLLCHASIVSRELGIPCVIGTKIATRVLKEGEYVEVDAENGIVRKVSEEEYMSVLRKQNEAEDEFQFKKEMDCEGSVVVKNDCQFKEKIGSTKGIFWFKELDSRDVLLVGGKAANLAELSKFVNVPNGFCVSAVVYKNFLKFNDLDGCVEEIMSGADVLSDKARQVRELVLSGDFSDNIKEKIVSSYRQLGSKKVAVRSSAVGEDGKKLSFAGQYDTYLNINNEQELLIAVKKCWASLFTDRAVQYREGNSVGHDIVISVIVQGMVQPKFAGVMFTKDPIDQEHILVEVVKGLGEKLVSGEVTPNNYLLDKNSFQILKEKVDFKVEPKVLHNVAELGKKIEQRYKSPQDIEWAIDNNGVVHILQTRPITTL